MQALPLLYNDLADWWPLLSAPADYAEEAAWYRQILLEVCHRPPVTLLELGSGGGNNASHLKARFQLTLVDLSSQMLATSRRLNPDCEHLQGDMRTVRLGRQFDAVFIHDAISYLTTEADLRQAIDTAFVHCRPGGAALFCPDFLADGFRVYTRHGGHDDGSRALRYLEWVWDPDPADTSYFMEMAYLLRDADGNVQPYYDRHEFGLFDRAAWLRIIAEAGFEARMFSNDGETYEDGGGEVFVGMKPIS